jgi:hypothetical protein
MSILGKVFAVLNILAAAVFVYFAVTDWSQRKQWSYAVLRQDLAIDGLPLTAEDKDEQGNLLVKKLSDQTMSELFSAVNGSPPEDKSQIGEVKRAQGRMRAEALAAEGDKKRLERIFLPLARTRGERDDIRAQIWNPNVQINQLIDNAFQPVLSASLPHGNDPGDKRLLVAHLLFNAVDPYNQDQNAALREFQRVAVVIGLKAFITEAERQSTALQEIFDSTVRSMEEEQAEYEKNTERVLLELRGLAEDWVGRSAKLDEFKALRKQHETLALARQKDLQDLKAQLELARAATVKSLQKLADEQQRTFDAQHRVATSTTENLKLLDQIKQLEDKSNREGR